MTGNDKSQKALPPRQGFFLQKNSKQEAKTAVNKQKQKNFSPKR